MQDRLQKILARAGVASRRAAERLIEAGRVRVNGKVISELGARADAHLDRVELDGKRIVAESPVYVLMHKPRAVMSTLDDPEGRPTVAEILQDLPLRLYPVGRLDYQTSGALLLTNDGDFTARMLHPRHHVPKTYLVKVQGDMSADDVAKWRDGVKLEDGITLPTEVIVTRREAGHTWFELILREGRNQQIRRMGEETGFPVIRLTRTAFAAI
ncbi:MAG: pseudouridine synthase, partial [Deltaproteobacteria bacterium HGW-Deltaproteobacteria-20]